MTLLQVCHAAHPFFFTARASDITLFALCASGLVRRFRKLHVQGSFNCSIKTGGHIGQSVESAVVKKWETCCPRRHARCYLAMYRSPCRANAWKNSQSFLLAQRQQGREQRLCRCSSGLLSWRLTCKMPQLGRRLPLTTSTSARTNSAIATGEPACS